MDGFERELQALRTEAQRTCDVVAVMCGRVQSIKDAGVKATEALVFDDVLAKAVDDLSQSVQTLRDSFPVVNIGGEQSEGA